MLVLNGYAFAFLPVYKGCQLTFGLVTLNIQSLRIKTLFGVNYLSSFSEYGLNI